MNRGYVKLWRKTIDSGLLQNAAALQVFTYCLLKASHKHTKMLVGTTPVTVEPGQVVTGRLAIAKECKLSEQNVRTALKLLENLEILTIKATNKFSLVSFVNWDTYQQDQPADQPTSQPMPNQQVTSTQPAPNHKQEFKNLRNNKIHSASDDAPRISKADSFNQFWDAFGYKKGKGGAEKAWNAIPHMDDALFAKILDAARKEATARPALIQSGRTPKMAQGWLNERRWEDEYDTSTVDTPKQEVDPRRATAMPIINEVAKEYGPWWQTGEETPEQYFEREEKMIQECLKRGCPEDIAREVQQ